MKQHSRHSAAFSLIEVVLAIGVVAFCLLILMAMLPVGLKTQQASVQQTTANQILAQILADLRADVRLPPGQQSKESNSGFGLHGHWAQVATPDTLYFTNDGKQTTTPTLDAAFRATIKYYTPPTPGYTTSLADVSVTWPAQVDPTNGTPNGSVENWIAVNR
jgi:uncharacterized protein (TIGR02598 family)